MGSLPVNAGGAYGKSATQRYDEGYVLQRGCARLRRVAKRLPHRERAPQAAVLFDKFHIMQRWPALSRYATR
jgi:hypothetical protein